MSLARALGRTQDFEAPLQELFFATLHTADQFERHFAMFLKPFGLTTCQYDILATLRDAGGQLPVGEIGQRLVRQASGLGAYIDRLASARLVTRERSAEDRRQVFVVLLEEGANALERIHIALTNWLEDLIGHLTDREAEVAVEILGNAATPRPR